MNSSILFRESFGPGLTTPELQRLDRSLGMETPAAIRSLLSQSNGGRPQKTVFPIMGMENNQYGEIRYFLGVSDRDYRDLEWHIRTFANRMPRELFPFACNDSGDLICLVTEGVRTGSVVFWDFYAEHQPPTWSNVYKIADSFEEFVESLSEYKEAPE